MARPFRTKIFGQALLSWRTVTMKKKKYPQLDSVKASATLQSRNASLRSKFVETSPLFPSQNAKRRFLRTSCLLVRASLALLIAGCGGGGGGSSSDAGSISQTVNSTPILGVITEYAVPTTLLSGVTAYPTSVYVPADYEVTMDLLPVFYVTDGVPDVEESDLAFEFADVCEALEDLNIRAIVVGITGQDRETDYLMPKD